MRNEPGRVSVRQPRLEGLDLARSIAMLGMFFSHTLDQRVTRPEHVLWFAHGRAAPLFVVLAGAGLTLVARAPTRPRLKAQVAARAVLLLLIGLAISTQVSVYVILPNYALYFLVGLTCLSLSSRVLAAVAGVGLVVGPIVTMLLQRADTIDVVRSRADVGFAALADPLAFLRALTLDGAYPAVVWLGFFFTGMLLARVDLRSARTVSRLFLASAAIAALVFTAGWAGARASGPVDPLSPEWSKHWTTYGHTGAVGWTTSSTALALAIISGCLWLTSRLGPLDRRGLGWAVAPLVALGQMALTFYLLHLVYLNTAWEQFEPDLTNTVRYLMVSVGFWLAFALLAWRWMQRSRRGPVEGVLHQAGLVIVRPPEVVPQPGRGVTSTGGRTSTSRPGSSSSNSTSRRASDTGPSASSSSTGT